MVKGWSPRNRQRCPSAHDMGSEIAQCEYWRYTNLYPNPFQPQRATFNRHAIRLLADRFSIRVIVPILWTDELKARWKGASRPPENEDGGIRRFDGGASALLVFAASAAAILRRFFQASVKSAFQRALAEFRPDLVFAPWAYPDGWAGVRLAHDAGLPAVIQVHGSDVLLLDKFPAQQRGTLEALRKANGIVAVSQDIANHLLLYGVAANRVRVIYDGVDANVFFPGSKKEARNRLGITEGDPLLLFIGNLVSVKAMICFSKRVRCFARGTAFRLVMDWRGAVAGFAGTSGGSLGNCRAGSISRQLAAEYSSGLVSRPIYSCCRAIRRACRMCCWRRRLAGRPMSRAMFGAYPKSLIWGRDD